jgi:large subunit ribosomal protein L22
MGARSRNRAENRKEEKKTLYYARLNNCPSSPRKMRLVADLVRGKKVEVALNILKNAPQQASEKLHKLLLSAISNWQAKNEGVRIEDSDLFVKEIMVDGGRMLKRIRTAPQGRAHRIRKRSNHVTLFVDARNKPETEVEEVETETAANETNE